MQISFKVLGVRERPSASVRGVVQLSPGDWDDYSFKTSFGVTLFDFEGKRLKELEAENGRLKRLLAESILDAEALKAALGRKR